MSGVLEGFILTRQQRDTDGGIALHYWLKTPTGSHDIVIPNQESVFFVLEQDLAIIRQLLSRLNGWRLAAVDLKDLSQRPVQALYCSSTSLQRKVIDQLSRHHIPMMEEDIRHSDRYLMERFIQGSVQADLSGPQPRIRPSNFVPDLKVLSIDLETTMTADRILSAGLHGRDFDLVIMVGEGVDEDWLLFVPDERSLLTKLVEVVRRYDPDLFIGWNVVGFDFRVLHNRAEQLKVPLLLGRDDYPLQVIQSGQGKWFTRMAGRVVIDGIDALKGATWQFESFSLEYVSRHLLNRGKLIDHPEQRGEEIQQLYRDDKPALARYNLEDCRLVLEIFDKAELFHYLLERAQLTGLTLDKVGGSAAAFDNQYLPPLHRGGYVAPVYASGASGLDAPGGYVMDSKPGLYQQVLVLDFKSLYPSIIRTFKVDPMGMAEGLREGIPEQNLVPGFNGAIFCRESAILPQIIERLWQARDQAKAANNAALSSAIKIIMNSFYGVLGSNVCRFYDQRLSGSITLRGHEILTKTRDVIEEEFGYTVIYGDTDSVFVWLGNKYPEAKAGEEGRKLAEFLNTWWQQQAKERFDLPCHLEIEYETHFRRFLMPTMRHSDKGTKKRYAGLQSMSDGADRMIFKGLENVRTDWTPLARELQEQLYERVFRQQEWRSLLMSVVADLKEGKLDKKLIYRKRIRQPLAEYKKNRPPHAQAAAKVDQYYQDKQLPSPVRPGYYVEYMQTVNGPEPLEVLRSPLDYQHYLDKQVMPVADTILQFLDQDFESLVNPQISLL